MIHSKNHIEMELFDWFFFPHISVSICLASFIHFSFPHIRFIKILSCKICRIACVLRILTKNINEEISMHSAGTKNEKRKLNHQKSMTTVRIVLNFNSFRVCWLKRTCFNQLKARIRLKCNNFLPNNEMLNMLAIRMFLIQFFSSCVCSFYCLN